MQSSDSLVAHKKLHPKAKKAIKNYASQFAEAVLLGSKIAADRDGADEVQAVHVEEARKAYLTLSQKQDRFWQIRLGTSFFLAGISITGLCGEFAGPSLRPVWLIFFMVIGFLGLLCLTWTFSTK